MQVDVLIIGAGLAGIACARDLADAGLSVQLLDKSRGVGGRASTRRFGSARLDHGAAYCRATTNPRLRALADTGLADGWLRAWPDADRFAPIGGMSDLPKRLADGLPVATQTTVTAIARTANNGGWTATRAEDDRVFSGRRLVLNLPPTQLAPLVAPFFAFDPPRFDPAWAALLLLEKDIAVDWLALELADHPILEWISREHTKRAPGAPPSLVVRANADWSRAHLEDAADSVRAELIAALETVVGPVSVVDAQAHRWRYAFPTTFYPEPSHYDAEIGLGFCGDWCVAGSIEGALTSGWNLAERMRSDG